jgi:Ala-tRNA(Pro) deacylase
MTVATIERKLHEEHVVYDLIRHEQTESAAAEAAMTGLPESEVGKTVVLVGSHGFVRAVLPASGRLDLNKLRDVVGCGSAVRLATEAELLMAYPMFELGAVPPFGGRDGDVTVLDHQVAVRETVVFEGGTHHESMRMCVRDLIRIADARVADITLDSGSGRNQG